MDWLDKALLFELYGNARCSFQDLAKKYKQSFNTIKNRVTKLEQSGVIVEYTVELSLEMLGADWLFVDIITDGSENMKTLIEQVGNHQMVRSSQRTSHRRYQAWALVTGTTEFFELKSYLESLEAVNKVEIHPFVYICPFAPPQSKIRTKGHKVSFIRQQLQILKCLTEDIRLPIGEIAKRVNMTPRRVTKILHELQSSGGVHFMLRMNSCALGDVHLELTLHFDETKTTASEIIAWIQEHYSLEFWGAVSYLDEPTLRVNLMIEDTTKVGEITKIFNESSFAESVEDQLVTPQSYVTGYFRDPSQHRLDQLFKEARL
ncbi:MAG: winged helix-turn-helix transcriptional regulator [Candidatus Thorarchaeota archaeon]